MNWIIIDKYYRNKLPKEDCKLWITRVSCFSDRWVQKIDYYAENNDIEWDGTIAFMIAIDDNMPNPCDDKFAMAIQNYR